MATELLFVSHQEELNVVHILKTHISGLTSGQKLPLTAIMWTRFGPSEREVKDLLLAAACRVGVNAVGLLSKHYITTQAMASAGRNIGIREPFHRTSVAAMILMMTWLGDQCPIFQIMRFSEISGEQLLCFL